MSYSRHVKIFIFFLLLLTFTALECRAEMISPDDNSPVVKIHGETITVHDIAKFAKTSPNFNSMIQFPGGPPRVLDELIWRKLLFLEGLDTGIIKPGEEKKTPDELLVRRVLKKLLPEFKPLTDEECRSFYETHKSMFSTPLMLRVSQIKVDIKDGGDKKENEKAALDRVNSAKKALDQGASFGDVVKKYSQDKFSIDRGGDLGFIPMEKIASSKIEKLLESLPLNRPSEVVKNGQAFVIYMVTAREEPVADPYDKVADMVKKKADEERVLLAMKKIRKGLEKKWGVEYLNKEWILKD